MELLYSCMAKKSARMESFVSHEVGNTEFQGKIIFVVIGNRRERETKRQ